jgi:hypothetical protein
MGRCQRAGTSKNKKVTENFPLASIFALGLRSENSLKIISLTRNDQL